jgi:hypothetical protein
MAELDQISVTGGIPSAGTGEVPTLAPVRDRLDTLINGQATIGTRAYDWASIDTVAIASASAASDAVGAAGEYELSADVDCYVLIGAGAPAATTSSRFLPAGSAWSLQLAATDKVAVIRKDTDGTLTILPVA